MTLRLIDIDFLMQRLAEEEKIILQCKKTMVDYEKANPTLGVASIAVSNDMLQKSSVSFGKIKMIEEVMLKISEEHIKQN